MNTNINTATDSDALDADGLAVLDFLTFGEVVKTTGATREDLAHLRAAGVTTEDMPAILTALAAPFLPRVPLREVFDAVADTAGTTTAADAGDLWSFMNGAGVWVADSVADWVALYLDQAGALAGVPSWVADCLDLDEVWRRTLRYDFTETALADGRVLILER